MATKAEDEEAQYVAECARIFAIWEEACAEAEEKMTPEQRKFAAAWRAAGEMQV
jgi:hypothetical protein